MTDSIEGQNRKRKLEKDETEKEKEENILISKKIHFLDERKQPELLDLADELLIEIAIKLDGESLHNVSLTCSHLKNLILDKKLWTEAVFASKDLDIWEILKRLKYLTVGTKKLKIQGDSKKDLMEKRPLKNRQTFKEIIKRIMLRSPFIESLHFHQIWFDWTRDWTITKFPANLRSLVFTNCILPKDRNRMSRTFSNIFDHMPYLEELRLEYCNFFEPNDLMPLSKIQELKILSLRGCKRFRNCVPYISLSCRFGFKKLEVLDLRETNISDSEVQCLNALKTLKELYLEHTDVELNDDDSDDDDDFQHFFRGMRRRPTEQVPLREPQNEPRPSTSRDVVVLNADGIQRLRNEALNQPSNSLQNENPSTMREIVINTAENQSAENENGLSNSVIAANIDDSNDNSISAPSSPESMSDSLPSESPTEEVQSRTIFIQANITENPNQNARLQVIISDDIPHASRFLSLARNREHRISASISDRGMLAFGVPRSNLMGNLIFLGNQQAETERNTHLERIVLRNFRNITDTTLSHLETNAPRLLFLDVRGCSQITRDAVERFKLVRGSCQIMTNYENEE
ncbi:unnamed protein product [Chironomus riparius]|uniref:F-box domain-containing protein n=1 Tax=Chironomus riparius TaxID=315576 RepID=A0A9N9RWF7_9DIPT|nr:unnamed protein product [Chironomus riparius]